MDTIVALSSGRPPAAIAVMRVSGPAAIATVEALAGRLPVARHAGLRALRDGSGALLDRALVLAFPGPNSATGEDLVEVHCHGGRAVVAAIEAALIDLPGVRTATPGEFTRRALLNGRIDLAQAEGLADLLEAETEWQRSAALQASEGQVSRAIRGWLSDIADLSARVEAAIDFADEGDVSDAGSEDELLRAVISDAETLRMRIAAVLSAPSVERLRDGVRVVIGGPPNSGKSTLFNLMVGRDAAIVSPIAGTTRDRIEAPVQRSGVAYLLTDTAGLNDAHDPVERIGVTRAEQAIAAADLLIWLADTPPPRDDAIWVHARADQPGREVTPPRRALAVRQDRQDTVETLWQAVARRASVMLPRTDQLALSDDQRKACAGAVAALAVYADDPLIVAEELRTARDKLGQVLGIDASEAMLDALFSRFCLGK